MDKETKEHWNSICASRKVPSLGYCETKATPSIGLLAKCKIDSAGPILDAGAGASVYSLEVLLGPPIDELIIPIEPLIIFLATTVILMITTCQFLAKNKRRGHKKAD